MAPTKEEWVTIFEGIDKDNDGNLSLKELKLGLEARNIFISKLALESALKDLDENHDGKVTKEEFVHVMSKKNIHDPGVLQEAFNKFDTDGSGFITKDELGAVMKSLGLVTSEEAVEEMMRLASRDDKISFREFANILR